MIRYHTTLVNLDLGRNGILNNDRKFAPIPGTNRFDCTGLHGAVRILFHGGIICNSNQFNNNINMSGIFKGTIIQLDEPKAVTDNFTKQDFVVSDITSQYPQEVLFQVSNKRLEQLQNLTEGSLVVVHYNLRGRRTKNDSGEYRTYNTLDVYKIERQQVNYGQNS